MKTSITAILITLLSAPAASAQCTGDVAVDSRVEDALKVRPHHPGRTHHGSSLLREASAECLNAYGFESLEDAEEILTSWRSDYSAVRQHSALGMLSPKGIR